MENKKATYEAPMCEAIELEMEDNVLSNRNQIYIIDIEDPEFD